METAALVVGLISVGLASIIATILVILVFIEKED